MTLLSQVWPSFWTKGINWPAGGEIDVIEGVHDNEHNQVTWHTMANCSLTPSADLFSGSLAVRISAWYCSEPHSFNLSDRKLH